MVAQDGHRVATNIRLFLTTIMSLVQPLPQHMNHAASLSFPFHHHILSSGQEGLSKIKMFKDVFCVQQDLKQSRFEQREWGQEKNREFAELGSLHLLLLLTELARRDRQLHVI